MEEDTYYDLGEETYYEMGGLDTKINEDKKIPQRDDVYETIEKKAEPVALSVHNGIVISQKNLIIFGLTSFLTLVIIIGVSVTLSYQFGKKRATKRLEDQHEDICGPGWLNISNECFLFADDACSNGCTWSYSAKYCKDLGGKLAEPRNATTLRKLIDYGSESERVKRKAFWIGLVDVVGKAEFEWVSDKSKAKIDAHFWEKDEPSYDGPFVHMVQKTMLLNDRLEAELNKPICQKSLKENEEACEDGWFQQHGKCYKFMVDTCEKKCGWKEAVAICREIDGYLTEGPDFGFLRNIAKSMKTTNNWWVGFSDLKSEGNYVAESDGRYVNLTKYFADGEPSDRKEHCLEMNYNLDFKLNDRECKHGGWETAFQPLCHIVLSSSGQPQFKILLGMVVWANIVFSK